jgi:hypothetical protein
MVGKIPATIFQQHRYLPPKTGVSLEFTFNRPEFCLDCSDTTKEYDYFVESAELYVRMHTINPLIASAHQKMFANKKAKYPFYENRICSVNIPPGTSSFESRTVFNGKLPTKIVLGMISNATIAGQFNKDPWNFEDYNLESITLTSVNNPALTRHMEVDFKKNLNLLGFQTIGSFGNDISREEYRSGTTLLVFNVQDTICDELHPTIFGEFKMTLQFSEPLKDSVTALLFGSFEQILELDGNGRVVVISS